MSHVNDEIPRIPESHAQGLQVIVQCCLAKEPKDRYQTVDELLKDLDDFRKGRRMDSIGRSRNRP